MGKDEIELRQLTRRRRWPWVVLAALLLFAGVLGMLRYRLHYRVETKLASIRAAGYPATLAELDAWYPIPIGPNAADLYQRAFDAYVEDEVLDKLLPEFGAGTEFPDPGEPLPADMAEAIKAYLAQNARALALLAEATAIRECRFPVDLTQGIAPQLPHLRRLIQFAGLLAFQAMVEADRGQGEHAAGSIKAILALADSMRNEPILVSFSIRFSIRESACLTVERLLGKTRWTDEQLADLSRAFAGSIDDQALQRGIAGERARTLDTWGTLAPRRQLNAITRIIGLTDVDRLAYLRIMGERLALAEDPVGYTVDLDALVRETPEYCFVTRLVTTEMTTGTATKQYADAMTRMVLVALTAERYQLAHGELPQLLDELVPDYLDAVPDDAFDGKPLRYKPTDTGAIVYSVSMDGVDNGGSKEQKAQDRLSLHDGTDIVFTIRR